MRLFQAVCVGASLFACLVVAAPPNDERTELLTSQAQAAQQKHDFDGAARIYRELIRSGVDSADLHNNLGLMLFLLKQNQPALNEFQTALRKDPQLASANLFAGASLIRLGRPQLAIRYLRKAVALQPDTLAPHLTLARAEFVLKQLREARSEYKTALAIDQTSPEAWYGLGVTCRALAEASLRDAASNGLAVSQHPDSPVANEAKDLIAEEKQAFDHAVNLDPQGIQTHLIMGEGMRIAGKFNESVAEYQEALRLQPRSLAAHIGLATTYWRNDRDELAISELQLALALAPDDPEGNALMAHLLVANRRTQEAKPAALKAVGTRPDYGFAHAALGRIYLAEGRLPDALLELKVAAAEDEDGTIYALLGSVSKRLGRTEDAQTYFRKSRELRELSQQRNTN